MEKGLVPFLQICQPRKDALVRGRQKGVLSLGLGAPCATQTEKWEVGGRLRGLEGKKAIMCLALSLLLPPNLYQQGPCMVPQSPGAP